MPGRHRRPSDRPDRHFGSGARLLGRALGHLFLLRGARVLLLRAPYETRSGGSRLASSSIANFESRRLIRWIDANHARQSIQGTSLLWRSDRFGRKVVPTMSVGVRATWLRCWPSAVLRFALHQRPVRHRGLTEFTL